MAKTIMILTVLLINVFLSADEISDIIKSDFGNTRVTVPKNWYIAMNNDYLAGLQLKGKNGDFPWLSINTVSLKKEIKSSIDKYITDLHIYAGVEKDDIRKADLKIKNRYYIAAFHYISKASEQNF